MKITNLFLPIIALLLFLEGCNRGEMFFKFQQIDKEEWSRERDISFEMDSLYFNTAVKYNAQLEVVYSNAYPYQDLWLTIDHNLTDSLFVRDTIRVMLIDDAGRNLGGGNAGLYQLSVPYKQSLVLDSASVYSVSVKHVMKDKKIKGINRIGLKVYQ